LLITLTTTKTIKIITKITLTTTKRIIITKTTKIITITIMRNMSELNY
jgi:hypothetical protein